MVKNSGDPDQMPQNAASDQGLHCLLHCMLHSAASDLDLACLPINLLGVSRLQWVKNML